MSSWLFRYTKNALNRALKFSDYKLKIKSISAAKNNDIRIDAHSVNLLEIKDSQELEKAGLKLFQEDKTNLRLLIVSVRHV